MNEKKWIRLFIKELNELEDSMRKNKYRYTPKDYSNNLSIPPEYAIKRLRNEIITPNASDNIYGFFIHQYNLVVNSRPAANFQIGNLWYRFLSDAMRDWNPAVSLALQRLFKKATSVNPKSRFHSFKELSSTEEVKTIKRHLDS